MSSKSNQSLNPLTGTSAVSPEIIEAAMQRGRRERSKAFWTMLQAVFGRPDGANERHPDREVGDRSISLAR
jgi:hypothetical protein